MIGAVYGVAGTIGQAAVWGPVPLGLVIAVIGVGALLLAVRLLTGDRWNALACGSDKVPGGSGLQRRIPACRGAGESPVVAHGGYIVDVSDLKDFGPVLAVIWGVVDGLVAIEQFAECDYIIAERGYDLPDP